MKRALAVLCLAGGFLWLLVSALLALGAGGPEPFIPATATAVFGLALILTGSAVRT